MAILKQPTRNTNPFTEQIGDDLAPAGTFVATVIDIHDEFGVQRQKFESAELEKVDLACFLFGFRDAQGQPHWVASRQMRISGNEKSALFGFLKSMLGKAPEYGQDYCTLKGAKCLLTVEHVQRRDGNGVFASIASLSPVPPGYGQPAQPAAPAVPAAQPRPQPAPMPTPAAPSIDSFDSEVPF